MGRKMVIVAALGVGVGALLGGGAAADTLVPGGWLEPVQIPAAPPQRPVVRQAIEAPAPLPRRIEHRRVKVRERRPPAAVRQEPLPDGKVRF